MNRSSKEVEQKDFTKKTSEGEYVTPESINEPLSLLSSEVFETVLPTIVNDPSPYLQVYEQSDEYPLLVKIYEAYELTEMEGYEWLKQYPTIELDFQKIRSHEEFEISEVQYLATEYQNEDSDEYSFMDINGQQINPEEMGNGEVVAILREANGVSAVYNNGMNIYGESFTEMTAIEVDAAQIIWNSAWLKVILKYIKKGGTATSGTNGTLQTCLRDMRDNKDYLHKIKMNSYQILDDIEENGFLRQDKLIFKCVIAYSETINGQTSAKKLEKVYRIDDEDLYGWFNWSKVPTEAGITSEVFRWDPTVIAKKIVYSWYELDDDGSTYESSVTIPSSEIEGDDGSTFNTPSLTVKTTLTPKDDLLGGSAVEYCDDSAWPGFVYNTGSMQFWVYD